MLETMSVNEKLNFQPLSAEEKLKRGILGRLAGPVASFKAPTRNGRKYSDKLWEKVFENDLVNELFARGGIPGELDHPDRDETCSEKIAIIMPEKPKKNKDGLLMGYFDILDTPCGRIAATLAKYGFNFGISSRGSGDTYTDYNGQESVDPDTYTLNAFDLVLIPACKDAVLSLVEGYSNNNGKSLSKALNEALDKATDAERKIMESTLDNLEINYSEEDAITSSNNIETQSETIAAENSGADSILELQEALQQNAELETKVKSLQEQLSVCYTKEARYTAILERSKANLAAATADLEKEKANAAQLQENLTQMRSIISEQNIEIKNLKDNAHSAEISAATKINNLTEKLNQVKVQSSTLNENINEKSSAITALQEKLKLQDTAHKKEKDEMLQQALKLRDDLQEALTDSKIIRSQSDAKLLKANKLVEKYKMIARTAVDKYIESRSSMLGISATEIKRRLKENYSFNDIDKVCEDLQQYKVNMKALPFNLSDTPIRMKINESAPVVDPTSSDAGIDDEIDAALISYIKP